jgi:hypothetical protein
MIETHTYTHTIRGLAENTRNMGGLVKNGSKYGDDIRRQAVAEYCVRGVITEVARALDVPVRTVEGWSLSDWWDDEVAKVRHEINDKILAQNLAIAQAAGDVVLDRLANGDVVLDKTGQQRRLPMKGRDAAVIGGISQDKARVQQGLATSIQTRSVDMEQLAERFRQISDSLVEKQVNVVDEQ